ncbi:hypothetical protein BB558_005123 [Smittium angustum]|uniref:Uncharacterized protein n=1 Tax=Smittium angustum TaxID=133377 RepID=A0A2U1J1D1_SMIAN|nr:hypothetical protein BB558_005123 [Smittium angustum]
MIRVLNKQKNIWIPIRLLKHELFLAKKAAGFEDWDLGIYIVNNEQISHINSSYRNQNKSTDILSFPFHDLEENSKLSSDQNIPEEEKNLGDLILSVEYANSYCNQNNKNLIEWTRVLLVHSICHLMGYDHENDLDYEEMHDKECRLLEKIQKLETPIKKKLEKKNYSSLFPKI